MKKLRFATVLLLFAILLNACTPSNPNEKEITGSTFSLEQNKVSYKEKGIFIELSMETPYPGRFVEIKKEPAIITNASEEDFISDRLLLQNFPLGWKGSGEIRISLPQEVISNWKQNPKGYQITVFLSPLYDQFSSTGGVSIPVIVDEKKKEAIIKLESLGSDQISSFHRLSTRTQEGSSASEGFSVQIRSSWGHYQYAESEHFKLRFTDAKDPSVGVLVLTEFEKVFNEIKALGLSLGSYENGTKFPIYLEYMDEMDGQFGCEFYLCPYISINSVAFANKQVITEIPLESIAAIAHETFHLVHYIDHKSYGREWDWLDEATAPWFEQYYLEKVHGVNGYVSPIAIANTGFFQYSQYSPPSGEARSTGYGASVFITRLVEKFGTNIIKDLYTSQSADQIALNQSLDNAGAGISIEWREFLETFVSSPKQIYPSENKVDEVLSQVGATINSASADGETKLTFENLSSAPFDFSSEPGLIDKEGNIIQPLTVTMTRNMYEVQAKNFLIMFSNKNPFLGSGKITLDFEGGEFSGLMVFGIPIGTSEVAGNQPLAGASTFLSTDNLGGGSTLVINNFGTNEKAKYDRLLLVPFSSKGTMRADSTTPITIHLTFEASQLPTEMVSTNIQISQILNRSACDPNPEGAYCCTGFVDPCYVPGTGGETGGMGEGNTEIECPPCREVPLWCWSCMSDALDFFYEFNASEMVITLHFDENGKLIGITDIYGPQSLYAYDVTPQIQFNPVDGSFTVTYRGLHYNNPPQQNAYLVYKGVVTGDTAQGSWVLGYDGIGEISSATWSASANR